jgi:hypothetical protein
MKFFTVILLIFYSSVGYCIENKALDDALQAYISDELPHYDVAYYDLNGDKNKEAVLYLSDINWCGSSGCTLLIFKAGKGKYTFISKTMITRKPILVSSSSTDGWFDIIVNTRGQENALLRFKNGKYPKNPSTQPVADKSLVSKGFTLLSN